MKKITLAELLEMISKDEQPSEVILPEAYDDGAGVYTWQGGNYFNNDNKSLLEILAVNYGDYTLGIEKLLEYEEDILTKKEKKYLSNVIKPFRKYVKKIVKVDKRGQEQLIIFYRDYLAKKYNCEGAVTTAIHFPTFKKGSMYKGMEVLRCYTLEELGL